MLKVLCFCFNLVLYYTMRLVKKTLVPFSQPFPRASHFCLYLHWVVIGSLCRFRLLCLVSVIYFCFTFNNSQLKTTLNNTCLFLPLIHQYSKLVFPNLVDMFSSNRRRKLVHQIISKHSNMRRKGTSPQTFQNPESKKMKARLGGKQYVKRCSQWCKVLVTF